MMKKTDLIITSGYLLLLPILWALSLNEQIDAHLARVLVIPLSFAVLALALGNRYVFAPRGVTSFFFLMWLLLLPLSILFSPVPEWTLRKILYFWFFAPLLWVFVHVGVRHNYGWIALTKAAVWGGGIASAIGIMQFFAQFIFGRDVVVAAWSGFTPFFLGGVVSGSVAMFNSWYVHILGYDIFRAIAFFPDPHVYAFYLGLLIPLAYGLFRYEDKKSYLMLFFLMLTANLLTFSRGAEVALLGGSIVAVFCFWSQMNIVRKHMIFFIIALLLLIAFLPGNSITARLLSSFDGGDTSNSARIAIWEQTIEIWKDQPLLGTGLGAYPYFVDPHTEYRTPIYAHNLFLDIGVELGIFGLMIFLGIIFSMGVAFWKSRSPLAPYAMISMCIFLTHSFFDTALYSVHVFPILLLLIAFSIISENSLCHTKTHLQ